MIKEKQTPQNDEPQPEIKKERRSVISIITWIIAVLMILLMSASLYQFIRGESLLALVNPQSNAIDSDNSNAILPTLAEGDEYQSVKRDAKADTVLPTGYRQEPVSYTVATGDSIFGIAEEFELDPETVLWANYDVLNDDPHMISVGQTLVIPPVDGILYEWQEGDTLEKIAEKYYANVDDILLYPGNDLDMTNPTIDPGTMVMVPGGYRAYTTWVVPSVASNDAGVNTTILGSGGCATAVGLVGTYTFSWPTPYRIISGNDYWSGHQALDMMCYLGDGITASDSGVVIYAGSISGGYGNMVMIDHGNGYQTLYAHLNTIYVSCGQSVYQGQVIGACGSTGNSTGPHLHFEIRLNGGFINPWLVLQ